jgi:hypothetical protein
MKVPHPPPPQAFEAFEGQDVSRYYIVNTWRKTMMYMSIPQKKRERLMDKHCPD